MTVVAAVGEQISGVGQQIAVLTVGEQNVGAEQQIVVAAAVVC